MREPLFGLTTKLLLRLYAKLSLFQPEPWVLRTSWVRKVLSATKQSTISRQSFLWIDWSQCLKELKEELFWFHLLSIDWVIATSMISCSGLSLKNHCWFMIFLFSKNSRRKMMLVKHKLQSKKKTQVNRFILIITKNFNCRTIITVMGTARIWRMHNRSLRWSLSLVGWDQNCCRISAWP